MPAEAQIFWPNTPPDDFGASRPLIEQRRARIHRARAPKLPDAPKDTVKPQGPIVIAISIEKQHLKLYDANGLFAESPVSTGMRGHSTPMGVFSIIQKNKWHRSNIYSGAPMPYMQRITWSGVALHAGVLPGYPASHGCIRMPNSFAMRLWGWTRMGARVVITPGEVSPADITHARLITHKPDPKLASSAALPPNSAETTSKSDRLAVTEATQSQTDDLRLKQATDAGEPIRTADASGTALPVSDVSGEGTPAKSGTPGTVSSSAITTDENPTAPPDSKAATATSVEMKSGTDTTAAAGTDAAGNKDASRVTDPAIASPPVTVAIPLEGAADFIGPVKPRSGHVAAFVSRKNGKLYVRQNFEPWFEIPVVIAEADRPLGTHVFTVRADKDNADAFRWSVVSLPAPVHVAALEEDAPKRRKKAPPVNAVTPLPPSSASEALDRLTIPQDAIKRIASALAPGGSIVVSDQGLGDETGRGTDFIVPLR